MKVEYLLFNIVVFIAPLLMWIFYPRKPELKVKPMVFAILTASLTFFVFDLLVTGWFWTFSRVYTLGINIGQVPVEEFLFFITVGFGCLFMWGHLSRHFQKKMVRVPVIPIFLFLFLLLLYSFYMQWWYTASVLFSVLLLFKTGLLSRLAFLWELVFVTVMTLIFNWYLTARPIVIYNSGVKSNIMIGPIPIEDFLFGIVFIWLVIFLYEKKK